MCQVREAILIDATPTDQLMNSKSEFGSNSVPRIRVDDDNTSIKRMHLNSDDEQPVMNNSSKRRKTNSTVPVNALQAKANLQVNAPVPSFNQLISKFCIQNAFERRTRTDNTSVIDQKCQMNAIIRSSEIAQNDSKSSDLAEKERKGHQNSGYLQSTFILNFFTI